MIRNVSWSSFVWGGHLFYRVNWWTEQGACSVATGIKSDFERFLAEKYREMTS